MKISKEVRQYISKLLPKDFETERECDEAILTMRMMLSQEHTRLTIGDNAQTRSKQVTLMCQQFILRTYFGAKSLDELDLLDRRMCKMLTCKLSQYYRRARGVPVRGCLYASDVTWIEEHLKDKLKACCAVESVVGAETRSLLLEKRMRQYDINSDSTVL